MAIDKIDERRLLESSLYQRVNKDLVIRRKPLDKQKKFKEKVRASKIEYTFLQFHHAILKWATESHNLTQREVSVLLYLYPLITFTSKQLKECLRELDSYDTHIRAKFRRDGWLNVWSKDGATVIYVLSNKANTLCARMHRMFMLEEQIPTSARRNVVVRKEHKKGNKLMDLFKKFNQKVKENEKSKNRKSG